MFVISNHHNCSEHDLNLTLSESNSPFREQGFYLMVCILPITVVAGFANALSVFIFTKQRFESQAVRYSLVCISIAEVAMLSSVTLEGIIVLVGIEGHPFVPYTFITSTIHVSLNATFCVRNWNVVLIAAARCEVVYRPLASRHRRFFSVRSLKCCQALLVLLSVFFALLNNLLHRGLVCINANDIVVKKNFLAHYSFFAYYEMYGIFMFQSCLPVVLISFATFLLFVKLRLMKRPSNSLTPNINSSCSHNNSTSSAVTGLIVSPRSRTPRQRVSYLVLILSFVFCLLEMPTFITTCVLLIYPQIHYTVHPNIFCNFLNVLDSFLNFFIYAFSSRRFRHMAKETMCNLFCSQCSQQQYRRRLTTTFNAQGTSVFEHAV